MQAPQTFDLVDEVDNLVISLNIDQVGIANWTIVANGDVDSSGSFNDGYTVAVDIV